MDEKKSRRTESVARSAFKVNAGSFLPLLTSILSQVVVAWAFGAGAGMDAFLTAYVIPNYLQLALLSGLSFALVPAFLREMQAGREDEAWALNGTVALVAGIGLTIVAVVLALFAPAVISITAPGLTPAKAQLASTMLGVLILPLPLIGVGGLATGIENARGGSFRPMMGPTLCSLGNVIVVVAGYRTLGPMALAWGAAISYVVQAIVPLVPFLKHGCKHLLPLQDRRVKEIGRLMIPFVAFGVFSRATPIVARYFASTLPDGDLSYMGYADRFGVVVWTILGIGISAAIFPAMVRRHEAEGPSGLAKMSDYGLRLTLAVAMPAAVILGVMGEPLVQVLFERGTFNHLATTRVGPIVFFAVLVAAFRMLASVLTRVLYVMKNTTTSSIFLVISSGAYVAIAYSFTARKLGYVGLAGADVLQWVILTLLLVVALFYQKLLSVKKLTLWAIEYGLIAVLSAYGEKLFYEWAVFLPFFIRLGLSVAGGASLYVLVLVLIDRQMASDILDISGVRKLFHLICRLKSLPANG